MTPSSANAPTPSMPTLATHTYLPQDSPEILALLSLSQHSGKGSHLPLMFTSLLFPVLLLHQWSQKHTNHTLLFPQRLSAISSGKQPQELPLTTSNAHLPLQKFLLNTPLYSSSSDTFIKISQ